MKNIYIHTQSLFKKIEAIYPKASLICFLLFFSVNIKTANAQCGNISPASIICPQTIVAIPYQLNFTGTEGGVLDKNNIETGFRMIVPHTAPRLAEDLPVSNTSVPGYEPSKIEITGGNLQLTSSKGLAFLKPPASSNNNTQVNTLGVGLQVQNRRFMIETTLINPVTGTDFAQAGVWYGFDEDNFVKIDVINNTEIEMRTERNGISGNGVADYLQVTGLPISGNNVRLRLEINNTAATKTVTGYYKIGTNPEVRIGTMQHAFHNGVLLADGVTNNVSFAGIYSSHRNGSQFIATFDNFIIQDFLNFTPSILNFTLESNQLQTQTANLYASLGNPTYTLSKSAGATWLTLPVSSALGDLDFTVNTTGYNAEDILQATVIASAPGYLDAVLTINVMVVPKLMEFRPNNLHFTLRPGSGNSSKTVELFSTSESIPVNLVKGAGAAWLTLPTSPQSGNLSFMVNTAGLSEGDTRSTTVTASAVGYTDAVLNIKIQMVGLATTLQFNFQEDASAPPSPWNIDFGQPFGARTAALQGFALNYGWKAQATGIPTDITDRGRLRDEPTGNLILQTLMHMQLGGNFLWELEIPNGYYQAEISAGDGGGAINSTHNIRVEGETVIRDFVPTANEFRTQTTKVEVTDGILTLDAVGGTNTKINNLILTPINNKLEFDKSDLNFILYSNEISPTQSVALSAETGALPVYTLAQFQTIPSFLNNPTYLQVDNTDPSNILLSVNATGLAAGYYELILRADASTYLDAEISIRVRVLATNEVIQVNFQNQYTTPPAGWIRDFGQAYGPRTEANQGNGLSYGWIENSDTQAPVDLVGNGRNRNEALTGNDRIDATLMHLQYDDIAGPFGIPKEGIWEIELPNGIYEVTVKVGDIEDEGTNNTIHYLNVEYLPFVKNFQQSTGNNFLTVTDFVNIRDGKLSVDAVGGFNTKINSITITKAVQPLLSFDQNILDIIAESEEEIADVFAKLSANTGTPTITLTESVTSGWLTLPASPTLGDLGFNVDVAGLESATYYTTVVAEAAGYVKAPLRIKLRVANINWTYKINFQRNGADPFTGFSTGVPTGYIPDYGYPYGDVQNPHTYGWVDLDGNPASNVVSSRYRNITGVDVRINTLNYMEHPTNPSRNWEIALPVGVYYIKLVAGDPDPSNQNSVHYVTAEGLPLIDFDQASTPGFYRETIRVIEVSDGKLNISTDPTLGTNTKISYIHIGPYELTIDLDKNTKPTLVGAPDRQMMRLNLEKNVDASITASEFEFNISGTNPQNIARAKLYNTGDEPLFKNPTLVGTPIVSPTGAFSFTGLSENLLQGDNYYWLVYDVAANANLGEILEVECTSISAGFADYVPTQVITGGRVIMQTDTIPDKVLSFANVGDYLEVPSSMIIPEQLSLEAWVRPNQSDAEAKWIMGEVDGVHFEQFGNQLRFYVFAEGVLQGPATATLPIGEWNHIAGTFDGTTLRIYVNGFEGIPAPLSSGNTNQNNEDQDNIFTFAAQNELELPNNIWIDEVRLWNQARSLQQIRENMHLVSDGLEPNLAAYWQFNQDTTNPELYDLVGDNTASKKGTIMPLTGLQPIGKGLSVSQLVNTGDGTTATAFGLTGLEITFGADNPEGEVVVTYLYNTPLGTEANPGFDKAGGYWIVNNFGDNDIDPVAMKFILKEDAVLSLNPVEFFLHKRGSREAGAWLTIQHQPTDVNITLGNDPGNNFVMFSPETGNTSLRGFSQFVISSDQKPLPVTFLGVQAQRTQSSEVKIKWQTAQEREVLSYEIEQSKDGVSFLKIGVQEPKAAPLNEYTFLYQYSEAAYYRIRQVDVNGGTQYSQVVFVGGEKAVSVEVYPNPTVSRITFKSTGIDTAEMISVRLVDFQGKIILSEQATLTDLEIRLNQKIPYLVNGMYLLNIQTAQKQIKLKLIKQ